PCGSHRPARAGSLGVPNPEEILRPRAGSGFSRPASLLLSQIEIFILQFAIYVKKCKRPGINHIQRCDGRSAVSDGAEHPGWVIPLLIAHRKKQNPRLRAGGPFRTAFGSM